MIKDFDEFERHFGAKKQPKQKLDWKYVGVGIVIGLFLGYAILIQLW